MNLLSHITFWEVGLVLGVYLFGFVSGIALARSLGMRFLEQTAKRSRR